MNLCGLSRGLQGIVAGVQIGESGTGETDVNGRGPALDRRRQVYSEDGATARLAVDLDNAAVRFRHMLHDGET
jgi:hypothetical protein